uniref:Caerulein precursor fragment-related peptide BM4 n=1 Tax=Xenopus boumbaensis TaxID=288550 RepID=CRBM4_XENBM|nr:RecName: Full=Caerulein precursor fragment-related peptide BM4; AltName: Full=CPF-RP-BM4 [Xenopus boumbaensis]
GIGSALANAAKLVAGIV